jgi:hypothetical protein
VEPVREIEEEGRDDDHDEGQVFHTRLRRS